MSQRPSIDTTLHDAHREIERGNYVTAMRMFEEIAEDSPEAALYVGWMFEMGLGVQANSTEAERRYRALTKGGSISGRYYLGTLLLKGQRFDEALEEFKIAVDGGHCSAAYWASALNSGQYGLPLDESRQMYYLGKAASLGHMYAKRDLALKRFKEAKGIFARAVAWASYLYLKVAGLIMILRNSEDIRVR